MPHMSEHLLTQEAEARALVWKAGPKPAQKPAGLQTPPRGVWGAGSGGLEPPRIGLVRSKGFDTDPPEVGAGPLSFC